jgi:Protein of unknown function (DUF3179)
VVYSRQITDKERFFGVSGLLYRSNVLMYDKGTESLWSQIKGEAVTGPLTGTELEVLPSTLTTWKKWQKKYPGTQVLSFETGFKRNYETDPYLDYYAQQSGFRSFFKIGPGEKEKELVVGIVIDGQAKAYPLRRIKELKSLSDDLVGTELTLRFDKSTDSLSVTDERGNSVESMTVYWFVWKAIWPGTKRF